MASFTARERWVLVATILGSSMVFIDGAAVTLALPQLQSSFHADASAIAWVVEGYGLALGALMLFGGALGDKIGRRKTFALGVALFALASAACAFANSILFINIARVLQGIGGMMLAPSSLALLGAQFSGAARGRAIAAWSAFGAVTSSIGPAVGGVLVDHLGWRSIFWINVPIAALVLVATWKAVAESRDEDERGKPLDVSGAAIVTVALGALTYALLSGGQLGWSSPFTLGALLVGIVGIAAFALLETRVANPLLAPAMFRNRTFTGVNVATLLLYGALGANFYEMPLVMIQGHGYSATATALATVPLVVCMVALARVGTALRERLGTRVTLTAGPLIAALGFALLALFEPSGTSYWTAFFFGILVVGIGLGLTVAPLTATVIDAADPRHVGAASGINSAIARIAALLAIAALALVVWSSFTHALDAQLDARHASPAVRAQVEDVKDRVGGARVNDTQGQAAITAAFRLSYRNVAIGCATLAALAALINGLLIEADTRRSVPEVRRG